MSRREFKQINNLLYQNGKKYTKDDENLPLKQFITAASCGTKYTGYLVKRKNLYYYKNNRIGSKENRSAKVMHKKFEELLSQIQLKDKKYIAPMKEIMKYVFMREHEEQLKEYDIQQKKVNELQGQLEVLEKRFVFKEIPDELYHKYRPGLEEQIMKVKAYNAKNSFNLSNLEKSIDLALQLSCNLQKLWSLGDLEVKKSVQHLVFPEGIVFDYQNDRYRTKRVNSLFAIIPSLSINFNKNKNGTIPKKLESSRLVLHKGIEPLSSGRKPGALTTMLMEHFVWGTGFEPITSRVQGG